jgi:23S rRNA (adenine2030-N6)-methyltransferase
VNEKLTLVDHLVLACQSMAMNYRHTFHAGNHGDVLKHAVLARVLTYLTKKASPLAVLDAHAGIGAYDLEGIEALKTGEWRGGIGKLLDSSVSDDLLGPYLDIVRGMNSDGVLRHYPGSPAVVLALLRQQDRLLLNELHPEDHDTLSIRFSADSRVMVGREDALQAIKAKLPFSEKRGLVLVDPAFEVADEAIRVARMVRQALRRMAHVCMIIWYPVTTQDFADGLCDKLDLAGANSVLRAEVLVRPALESGGLAGSGVVVTNPPWTLHAELEAMLPVLAGVLGENGQGRSSLRWMVQPR